MAKYLDRCPPHLESLAETVLSQVTPRVLDNHTNNLVGVCARRAHIEPADGSQLIRARGDIGIDHHKRSQNCDQSDGEIFDLGLCTAALIVFALIHHANISRDTRPVIPQNPDLDQAVGAAMLRTWNASGKKFEVLRLLERRIEPLLAEEFWLQPKVTVERFLEEQSLSNEKEQHIDQPAKITVYKKAGYSLPVLHIEMQASKQSFTSDDALAKYARVLALSAGITFESCIVFIQTRYSRTPSDQRKSSGTLGIMGSYNNVCELPGIAKEMSPIFKTIALEFQQLGFESIHASSRNMLTIVKPTKAALAKLEERGRMLPEMTIGERTYYALAGTFTEIMTELGFRHHYVATVGQNNCATRSKLFATTQSDEQWRRPDRVLGQTKIVW